MALVEKPLALTEQGWRAEENTAKRYSSLLPPDALPVFLAYASSGRPPARWLFLPLFRRPPSEPGVQVSKYPALQWFIS